MKETIPCVPIIVFLFQSLPITIGLTVMALETIFIVSEVMIGCDKYDYFESVYIAIPNLVQV